MKTQLFAWFVIFSVWSCTKQADSTKIPDTPPPNTDGHVMIEEAALYRNNITLIQGHFINRARPQIIDYKKRGQSTYRIKFEAPVVAAVAGGGEGWGYFQFPKISWSESQTIQVAWQMKPDAVDAYGDDGFNCTLSTDMGKTWTRQAAPPEVVEYIDLPDGDKLSISTPKPFLLSDYQIQPIPGTNKYLLSGLPEALRAVYFNRKISGSSDWQTEMAGLGDPTALRYSQANTYFPIVWWGDMQVQADQS
ncbi:MAG TPA: hypothetical protein PKA53_09255, partial [Sphingobacterium sp.]|nr:hypothetical protein [Sphingobacterium sp.]